MHTHRLLECSSSCQKVVLLIKGQWDPILDPQLTAARDRSLGSVCPSYLGMVIWECHEKYQASRVSLLQAQLGESLALTQSSLAGEFWLHLWWTPKRLVWELAGLGPRAVGPSAAASRSRQGRACSPGD